MTDYSPIDNADSFFYTYSLSWLRSESEFASLVFLGLNSLPSFSLIFLINFIFGIGSGSNSGISIPLKGS